MKNKNIKVAYSTRYQQSGISTVPKIQMEGKWLEELGFSIGSTIVVEYEEGSIRIRPLTAAELAIKRQQELRAEMERRTTELRAEEKKAAQELERLSKVAESSGFYGI